MITINCSCSAWFWYRLHFPFFNSVYFYRKRKCKQKSLKQHHIPIPSAAVSKRKLYQYFFVIICKKITFHSLTSRKTGPVNTFPQKMKTTISTVYFLIEEHQMVERKSVILVIRMDSYSELKYPYWKKDFYIWRIRQ